MAPPSSFVVPAWLKPHPFGIVTGSTLVMSDLILGIYKASIRVVTNPYTKGKDVSVQLARTIDGHKHIVVSGDCVSKLVSDLKDRGFSICLDRTLTPDVEFARTELSEATGIPERVLAKIFP